MLLTTAPADVVHLFDNAGINVAIVLGSRLATDIGRGRYQCLLEAEAQFLRERLLRDAQGNASILSYQIRGQIDSTIQNEGGGFDTRRRTVGNSGGILETIDELPGDVGHVADIALQTGVAVHQANHGLRIVALLNLVDTLDGLGICGITANAPYGVRRIEDDPTLLQHLNSLLNIFFSRHIKFMRFVKFVF